ncbi:MAG: glycosyltransferase family 4 protein, partial [Smithella sp.]|nr:glycosyltransferase family 4 protein [Smithella sp.]
KIPFARKENAIFWFCFIIRSMISSYRLAIQQRIDTIFTFGPFNTAICFLPIVIKNIPAVTFVRADNMKHSTNILRNLFFYIFDWFGLKLSSKIIVVNSTLKEIYCRRYRISACKICVQPNNIEKQYIISDIEKVETRKSLGINMGEFLITTSGVFNEGKNFELLILAMKHIKQKKVKLAIVGDEVTLTGERQRLECLVTTLGLQEQIIFCGWQENPSTFIACSDLYVYPSRYEGSPNSLLEALGCMVPCLGSRIEEISEILRFDELLFPLNDEKILAQKILKAAEDQTYYENLKKLSLACCESFLFDWSSETIKKIVNL